MTGVTQHGSRGEFRRLFGYVRPHLLTFLTAVVLTALVGGLETVITALVIPLVDGLKTGDSLTVSAQTGGISGAIRGLFPAGASYWPVLAGALVVITATKGVAEYSANMLMTRTGLHVVTRLRRQLFDHILRQSPVFFHSHPTNSLVAHLANDTEKVQLGVSYLVADLLREGFTFLGLLGFVFVLNWKLTLVFLAVGPLVYLVTVRLGRRLRHRSNAALKDTEALFGAAQEAISGIPIVKAFVAEPYESDRFGAAAERQARSLARAAAVNFLSSPLLELIGMVAIALFLLYAQAVVARSEMSAGALIGWVVAVFRLYDPVRRLSRVQNQYQQAFAASERVFALLDTHTEQSDPPGAVDLPPFAHRIEFRGVSFRYPDSDRDVLDGVDLTIEAGQVVALVGYSGAGKSTLASILLRLNDPTDGALVVDGVDVRTATLGSLRRQVAFVSQETVLFDDTVRANVAYGRPDMPLERVKAAARAAYASEFVEERPEGFATLIGERGVRFSGGQRQRLAVARAIAKDAPILVLDEATSSLDTRSEREVQRALANLMEGRTTLVIAHRLSTIQRADKIVVLESGRIVETGRHEELLSRGGLYRELYEMQFEEAQGVGNDSTPTVA
jgi:subfamily B ATP-binding cassette protein MsbA